uniref:Uncharacterized protein n=1 Tax=Romanomermis culicivorax TaxID=13658 RepID=A0A915K4W1_ROMCU
MSSVKIYFNDEVRRFPVPTNNVEVSASWLFSKIQSLYPKMDVQRLNVLWRGRQSSWKYIKYTALTSSPTSSYNNANN